MTNKTILLIEDCPAQAKLAQMAFKEMAIPNTVIHYSNGFQLLEHLHEHGTRDIAYVLLDLNMPEINGKEVLKAIQENHAFHSLPVLVYSSSGFEDDIEECYALGAKAYIRKPIDYFRFKELMQKTYDFWVGTSTPASHQIDLMNQTGMAGSN